MMSGGNSRTPAAGMTVSWIGYAIILVVGILSLFSLYMGFLNYADNPDIGLLYMMIGTVGFAAIGYLLFRGRPPATSQDKLDIKKFEVFTTLECPKCQLKRVRDFKRGDFVFKDDEPCTRCDGKMVITRISRKKEDDKKEQASWL